MKSFFIEHKKQIILIIAAEILLLAGLLFVALQKEKKNYLVGGGCENWISQYATVLPDGSWRADESLWKDNGGFETGENKDFIYGPYISLPAGEYVATIDYECDNNQEFYLHAFEADPFIKCFPNPINSRLETNLFGKLFYDKTSVSKHFRVTEPIENLEVRVKYNTHGYLDIKNITIATSSKSWKVACVCVAIIMLLADAISLLLSAFGYKRILKMIPDILAWAWVVGIFAFDVVYVALMERIKTTSDIASDVLCAQVYNEDRAFFLSRNWFYSTGIPGVYSATQCYRVGELLSPNNWVGIRIVGMILLLVAMGALLYFVLKKAGISRRIRLFCVGLLLCPMSSIYMSMVTFGGFYTPFAIGVSLTLLIVLFAMDVNAGKKQLLVLIIVFAYALIDGISGIRSLTNMYLPIMLSACILLLQSMRKKNEGFRDIHSSEWRYLFIGAAGCAGALNGFIINTVFLSPNYNYYKWGDFQIWTELRLERLFNVIENLIQVFGYRVGVEVMSFEGTASACGLAIGLLIIVSLIRILHNWKSLDFVKRILVTYSLAHIVIVAALYAWTAICSTNEAVMDIHLWCTSIAVIIVLVAIELQTESFSLRYTRRTLISVATFFVLISAAATAKNFDSGHVPPNDLRSVARYLVSRGCTQGYAPFWHGNILTELSDGQIEVWATEVYPSHMGEYKIWEWLQRTSHKTQIPQGDYFIIVPAEWNIEELPQYHEDNSSLIYTDVYGDRILLMPQNI